MVLGLTLELHLVAIIGVIVPSVTTKHLSFNAQAARLVPQCFYGTCSICDNEGINNHPLKKFDDEDQEVVVVLVQAHGTKQDVHSAKVFILKS